MSIPKIDNNNINNNSSNVLKERIEKCSQEVSKLKKQITQLIIANGNIMTSIPCTLPRQNNPVPSRHPRQNNNVYLNANNSFNANTLVKNYGFSPKVASKVASKIRRSGKGPDHYSKQTGLLKRR